MKKDIILAGVGGQGILSIAATIGMAAVDKGLYLKQAEVHGMSQQGGVVQSHLRLSDRPIASDLIPEGEADIILAVEPLESLKYLPWLAPEGWLITNTVPFKNISNYPHIDEVIARIKERKNHVAMDAESIAKNIGSVKATNIVVLGAAAPFLGIEYEAFEKALRNIFGRKGEEIVNMNLKALKSGQELATANN
ncbi:MAG: indolepyruvate oxidoreductase subunit beta [Bacteroidales bacterium]|nr:indolepyruvate oxidoreductase subunit beta [Bacteroidales bacterium]